MWRKPPNRWARPFGVKPPPDPSERQQAILAFIRAFLDERGYAPSVREIAAGCALKSTSVVAYNLRQLEDMGLCPEGSRREPGQSRTIVLVQGRGT